MLSLIQRILRAATSFDTVLSRLDRIESAINKIETKIKKFDKIADENDSLWQMLDEQREMEQIFVKNAEDYNKEIAEILLRNAKVQGDA
jgi:predicted DNA binding CopG/RHH family protein